MATETIKNGAHSAKRRSSRNSKPAGKETKNDKPTNHLYRDAQRKRKNSDSIKEKIGLKKTRHVLNTISDTLLNKKKWIVNAFAMQSPGHLNPGLFKHPGDAGRKYNDIKNWISIAKKLEHAKFHAIFFADVLGGYDVYKGPVNLHPTIPAAAQFPINDPLYAVSASTFYDFGIYCC
jgi:hypothetical protein